MTDKNADEFSRLLDIFDKQELNDVYGRRAAYKPLYEYFQKLVLEVGVEFCNSNSSTLMNNQLKTRWDIVKDFLSYIENPKTWDNLINEMYKIRNGIEHNDYYDPNQNQLTNIRAKAPEFKEWIIRVATEYYKTSINFTFKQSFYQISKRYLYDAQDIIQEYGENPPHVSTSIFPDIFEESSYQQLSELVKTLPGRLENIENLEDVERQDLENLIQLVKIISNFKGKEEILLRFSVCPKCGSKIEETHSYIGGNTENNPEPTAVYIRVGCEKCDYVLNTDTIDI